MPIQTYYVNSATGSDLNDGSIGSPWETLEHAIDAADWANDLIFDLTGTFNLASPLDSTNANANDDVVFAFVSSSDAIININDAAGMIGNWGYRRMIVRGCVLNAAGNLAPQGFELFDCTVNCLKTTAYTIFSDGFELSGCTVTGTGDGVYLLVKNYCRFSKCRFNNIRYLYGPSGAESVLFSRCLFLDCVSTVAIWMSIVTPTVKRMVMDHCTFINVTSAGEIVNSGERDVSITNSVFVNCDDIGGNLRDYSARRYSTNRGTNTAMWENDNTLSTAPYTGDDHDMLSPELTAIVGPDGLTPGYLQAPSGGGIPIGRIISGGV